MWSCSFSCFSWKEEDLNIYWESGICRWLGQFTHLTFMPTGNITMEGVGHTVSHTGSPHEHIPPKLHIFSKILKVHYCYNYWWGYEENMLEKWKTKGQLWDPRRKLSRSIGIFWWSAPILNNILSNPSYFSASISSILKFSYPSHHKPKRNLFILILQNRTLRLQRI